MDGVTGTYLQRAIADGGTGNAEIVRELESRFTDLFGLPYGLCVSSGTAALICALRALGVRPRDRVALSVLGPAMTGLAVAAVGAEPVFIDSAAPTSFGLDAAALAAAAGQGVAAAIVVPMWGYWDEDATALAGLRAAGVPVIVDAAQAPFLRLHTGWSDLADVVCLSLHGRKPIKAGEGGICLTGQAHVAEKIAAMRSFGQRSAFTGNRLDPTGSFAHRFGTNFKINALGAGWCLAQMDIVEHIRQRHTQLRVLACSALDATGVDWSEARQAPEVDEHGRYGIVALCATPADAQRMAASLAATGIEVDTTRYGYAPMDQAPFFTRTASGLSGGPYPNAHRLTTTAVACRLETFAPHLPTGA
ncbi:DegT/DnrJ/EryC1/StrS family aminotransferase [Microbispora sp. NBRC 16548]|uniref:DegT/DnrJ/EryC1/StrS family aminotransferase n=1 Tax=Microbispora sp. NBRC 16548 TaxID=3030994 RepID=UPI0024A02CDB|nr:DegT/DnrJ/EryC1/StrS family aminotransferase [Microbispora sp. NBRC 16548]GLX06599.1 hypothetical protein Misp03_35260 [Microbispora sp. NBRC 16548]